MKTTFIATVLNEEKTIGRFLESIVNQSTKPDQIVITDGGSTDKTVEKIKAFQKSHHASILLLQKKGNRSIGRNVAIEKAKGDIIFCSDAGCVLDKDWIKNILKPFSDKSIDVVAGYYQGIGNTVFQKCLIPYVLVMPDKVDPNSFLPATRSMAFRKKVWESVGKFPEQFSHNEDYVFAKELQKRNMRIIFAKEAIVYWYPPADLDSAYTMFYRFAKGDAQARIFRPKVVLIFIRYFIFVLCLIFITSLFYLLLSLYIIYTIMKNYKYVQDLHALYILPLLQFTSDIAVIRGTIEGLIW